MKGSNLGHPVSYFFQLLIISFTEKSSKKYGTFLQQLECEYGFPVLIHAWIASAGSVRMVYKHSWLRHSNTTSVLAEPAILGSLAKTALKSKYEI